MENIRNSSYLCLLRHSHTILRVTFSWWTHWKTSFQNILDNLTLFIYANYSCISYCTNTLKEMIGRQKIALSENCWNNHPRNTFRSQTFHPFLSMWDNVYVSQHGIHICHLFRPISPSGSVVLDTAFLRICSSWILDTELWTLLCVHMRLT